MKSVSRVALLSLWVFAGVSNAAISKVTCSDDPLPTGCTASDCSREAVLTASEEVRVASRSDGRCEAAAFEQQS